MTKQVWVLLNKETGSVGSIYFFSEKEAKEYIKKIYCGEKIEVWPLLSLIDFLESEENA